ncbi:MAG: VirE protein, partial [Firmicutes bacterium]|nr:VirE protein [Bacillota bacterium]
MENSDIIIKFEEPIVSLFENIYSKEAYKRIKLKVFLFTEKFKEEVEAYRKSDDEKERKKIKESLPCITPSGTFTQRRETPISTHTNLICIDIDAKHNPKIDLKESKHIIGQHCPSLYYAGLSIGGEGIFLIFRILKPELHSQHFDALASYLNKTFDLNVDKAVRSLNSLRVVSYDENPYYNPDPIPYEHISGKENRARDVLRTVAKKNEISNYVERAIKIISEKKIDITVGYVNWFKIGSALAHEFGEEGRARFQVVSYFHKDYYH